MATTLYNVVHWLEENGEVKAVDRLRMTALPDLLAEGIRIAQVEPSTACSAQLLAKLRQQASIIAGQTCPA